jgi:putative ribosome biogenesis GTPase RsgA
MILVATKADMENDRKVTRKQGEMLSEKYNIKFIETSAKNCENVSKVFDELTADIIIRYGNEDKLK